MWCPLVNARISASWYNTRRGLSPEFWFESLPRITADFFTVADPGSCRNPSLPIVSGFVRLKNFPWFFPRLRIFPSPNPRLFICTAYTKVCGRALKCFNAATYSSEFFAVQSRIASSSIVPSWPSHRIAISRNIWRKTILYSRHAPTTGPRV